MSTELPERRDRREIIWICLYCESSNYSEFHICEVCTNQRIYTHEEVAEVVQKGGLSLSRLNLSKLDLSKLELNPW